MDDKDRFGVSLEEQLAAYKAKIEAARAEAKERDRISSTVGPAISKRCWRNTTRLATS